jgi:hypothetical protein
MALMNPINEYDENPSPKRTKELREYAVELETKLNAVDSALTGVWNPNAQTRVECIKKLRKFYTHDKERYQQTLKLWADAFEEIKLKAGDIVDDVNTALGN